MGGNYICLPIHFEVPSRSHLFTSVKGSNCSLEHVVYVVTTTCGCTTCLSGNKVAPGIQKSRVELGGPVAPHKVEGHTSVITFPGTVIDSGVQQLHRKTVSSTYSIETLVSVKLMQKV